MLVFLDIFLAFVLQLLLKDVASLRHLVEQSLVLVAQLFLLAEDRLDLGHVLLSLYGHALQSLANLAVFTLELVDNALFGGQHFIEIGNPAVFHLTVSQGPL